ncbi:unnamed protein product [Mycena citricolor]|uniref:Uncharacterized protein n=1 Tax=Mycena citricolor TaxID=2018698 RepID=A0AAD2HW55_9AGAR|nr:unnamed protein product [Mycena citricolor]
MHGARYAQCRLCTVENAQYAPSKGAEYAQRMLGASAGYAQSRKAQYAPSKGAEYAQRMLGARAGYARSKMHNMHNRKGADYAQRTIGAVQAMHSRKCTICMVENVQAMHRRKCTICSRNMHDMHAGKTQDMRSAGYAPSKNAQSAGQEHA